MLARNDVHLAIGEDENYHSENNESNYHSENDESVATPQRNNLWVGTLNYHCIFQMERANRYVRVQIL